MSGDFKIAHSNVRSLQPHLNAIKSLVRDENLDVLCVTETWLLPSVSSAECKIPGYCFVRKDFRGRGSGVGCYLRENLAYKTLPCSRAIEQLCLQLTINRKTVVICVVYRNHDLDYKIFIDEVEDTIANGLLITETVFVLGDVNINLFKTDDPMTRMYNGFIAQLGVVQLIREPTRNDSLLDHILATDDGVVLQSGVLESDFSDHDVIFCTLNVKKSKPKSFFITGRNFKNFNKDSFYSDLLNSELESIYYTDDIDKKVEVLTTTLQNLFDAHAPVKKMKISRPPQPWISDNTKFLISLKHNARAKYRRTLAEGDWNYYKQLRNLTTITVRNERKAYFKCKFKNNDCKTVFKELKTIGIISTKSKTDAIPVSMRDVNKINDYFISSLPGDSADDTYLNFYNNESTVNNNFNFTLITSEQIVKCLDGLKSNASGIDGLTVNMIIISLPYILTFIENIINSCILSGYFPCAWKQSIVTPIAKIREPTEIKHLRSISLLPVLSKVFEKILHQQLRHYLNINNILPDVQSGFRSDHSCVTALCKITDDILTHTDNGLITALVLLDFTRAFDTISHRALVDILKFIGLSDSAVALLNSYLSGRAQVVRLCGMTSDPLEITSGVPQGSILGPLLFTIYTHQFPQCVQYCNIHLYADDTQLYYSFDESDVAEAVDRINSDLQAIYDISIAHSLILNSNKSTAIVFGSQPAVDRIIDAVSLKVNNESIPIVKEVKNLGLLMDNSFRYRGHVNRCLQRGYSNLRLLYPHRSYLPLKTKIMLCESLVLSQINYCSEVFSHCLDAGCSYKLQKLQNSCLRFIYGIRKFDHVSHRLKDTNWLSIKNRYKLKSMCFYHSIVTKKAPQYLYNKLTFRTDVHNINIRKKDFLTVRQHNLTLYNRSFSYNICVVYNGVPAQIKALSRPTFRKHMFGRLLELQ